MTEKESKNFIEQLIASFPDGDKRFIDSEFPLRKSWFPIEPELIDDLNSDYGVVNKVTRLSSDFFKEVEVICNLLGAENIQQEIDRSKETNLNNRLVQSIKGIRQGMNIRGKALAIWNWYAIPLRLKGKTLYRIWAPRDIFGEPIIKSMPLLDFLSLVSIKTAKYDIETTRLQEDYTKLKEKIIYLTVSLILLIILLFIILINITR